MYIVTLESELYGAEDFPYYTESAAAAGFKRLCAKAAEHFQNDGVHRTVTGVFDEYSTEDDDDLVEPFDYDELQTI